MDSIAYFISDAHLGANPPGCVPHREERLVELFHSWKGKAHHVFILGDLFEFWMEYRHYVGSQHFKVLRALADLVDSGCEVHALAGNHDFAYGSFFPQQLGVQVHPYYIAELQGHRLFLCHGDGLAASDWGYRWARKIIDFPLNRFLFRQLHPDWGMALANWVGSTSRHANQERQHPIPEYLAAAQQQMQRHQCNLFIQGHLHLKQQHTVPEGQIVFCGQWLYELGYWSLSHGQCQFHTVTP